MHPSGLSFSSIHFFKYGYTESNKADKEYTFLSSNLETNIMSCLFLEIHMELDKESTTVEIDVDSSFNWRCE